MLSACMITQDEEECISRSIENIMGAVDEVVVLDGGSTDRTCQIAESYPKVRLFKFVELELKHLKQNLLPGGGMQH